MLNKKTLLTCDPIKHGANLVAHNVAGETDHMCAQTEADQMDRLEALHGAKEGAHLQHEPGHAFARLSCVQHGRGIARQLREFTPVGYKHICMVSREVG